MPFRKWCDQLCAGVSIDQQSWIPPALGFCERLCLRLQRKACLSDIGEHRFNGADGRIRENNTIDLFLLLYLIHCFTNQLRLPLSGTVATIIAP